MKKKDKNIKTNKIKLKLYKLTHPGIMNGLTAMQEENNEQNTYTKDVSRYKKIDIYRILKLYQVLDPCIQHAIKKLLCAGQRGVKNQQQDVAEAICALQRFEQIEAEDN